MNISGFNKLTLTDYPEKVACIVFTQGCNFNCGFCHNSGLIKCNMENLISEQEVFDYLEKRKNVIDGVVISGGEPTIQKDLTKFAEKVKQIGYSIKLDTNGTNPDVLKEMIDNSLVDYIAMDVKNVFDEYSPIVNKQEVNINKIKQSIDLIKKSNIQHEFRTTIIKDYHNIDKIAKITEYLGKEEKYFLQNFENSSNVIDRSLSPFTNDMLQNMQSTMNKNYPNVIVRGFKL